MPESTLTAAQLAIIWERAQQGESVKQLARELDRDDTSLYRLLKRRYGYRAKDFRRAVWAPTLTMPTKPTDLAYIAGIIDGEGSIMQRRRPSDGGAWLVRVNMTHEPVIRWLASFGGRFCERPPAHSGGRKDQFEWMVARQLDIAVLLRAILPYMRVKRERAQECLAYLASKAPPAHNGRLSQHR